MANLEDLFDFDFIHSREGFETTLYVPMHGGKPLGISGATVGYGLDLGQMNRAELDRLVSAAGLGSDLADKLAPYLEKKGQDAADFLSANPCSVTAAEAKALSIAKYGEIADRLMEDYAEAIQGKSGVVPFVDLPKSVRTVALSITVQYGSMPRRTPKAWGLLTSNNIDGLVAELRNFGDKYPSRRNAEADLIEGK